MKQVSKMQIAQSYAQALYEAAQQEKMLKAVFADCDVLAQAFENSPELKYLNHPGWTSAQKKAIISELAKKLKLSQPMSRFFELVAENKRTPDINEILEKFKHLYYQNQGFLEVFVESVQALSQSQNEKLKTGLENILGQNIVINYNINPEILGGLVISYGSIRIDDSFAGKLNRLEQLMKGNL